MGYQIVVGVGQEYTSSIATLFPLSAAVPQFMSVKRFPHRLMSSAPDTAHLFLFALYIKFSSLAV